MDTSILVSTVFEGLTLVDTHKVYEKYMKFQNSKNLKL